MNKKKSSAASAASVVTNDAKVNATIAKLGKLKKRKDEDHILTEEGVQQLQAVLAVRGGALAFGKLMERTVNGLPGAFDFATGWQLATPLGPEGPNAFANRLTGLDKEQPTGIAAAFGLDFMDYSTLMRKLFLKLDEPNVEDIESISRAINSMFIGTVVECFLAHHQKQEVVQALQETAEKIGRVLSGFNYNENQDLTEAHVAVVNGIDRLYAQVALGFGWSLKDDVDAARKERRRAMNNASRAARKAKAKLDA